MFVSHLSRMLVLLMIAEDMPPSFTVDTQAIDLLRNQRTDGKLHMTYTTAAR